MTHTQRSKKSLSQIKSQQTKRGQQSDASEPLSQKARGPAKGIPDHKWDSPSDSRGAWGCLTGTSLWLELFGSDHIWRTVINKNSFLYSFCTQVLTTARSSRWLKQWKRWPHSAILQPGDRVPPPPPHHLVWLRQRGGRVAGTVGKWPGETHSLEATSGRGWPRLPALE